MIFSAIPDILLSKDAVDMISKHLLYPPYFLKFIGIAKLLGGIVILVPGFPRLKEWVYAGFTYDLAGAAYSIIAVGDPVVNALPIVIGFALIALSYIFHHKRLKAAYHRR